MTGEIDTFADLPVALLNGHFIIIVQCLTGYGLAISLEYAKF